MAMTAQIRAMEASVQPHQWKEAEPMLQCQERRLQRFLMAVLATVQRSAEPSEVALKQEKHQQNYYPKTEAFRRLILLIGQAKPWH